MLPSSLIIASRNRPDLLRDAVESILKGAILPTELVVIDQSHRAHPTLASSPPAGRCQVRYVWVPSRGLSRGNNLGIGHARHEILAFTHDDILAERNWFGSLLATVVREGDRTIVTGRVLPAEDRADGFAPSVNVDSQPRAYEGTLRRDVLYPLNMAMYRRAIEAVGGFDERLGPGTRYPAAEDNDLGHRLLEAGFRIVFEPTAVVRHRAWRSRAAYTRLRFDYGRGQGAFYAKHLLRRDGHMLGRLRDDVLGRLIRLPIVALLGRRRIRDEAAYLCGLFSAMFQWLLTERR